MRSATSSLSNRIDFVYQAVYNNFECYSDLWVRMFLWCLVYSSVLSVLLQFTFCKAVFAIIHLWQMMIFYLLLMIFIIICVACLFPSGMSSVADGEDASSTLGEGKEDLFLHIFIITISKYLKNIIKAAASPKTDGRNASLSQSIVFTDIHRLCVFCSDGSGVWCHAHKHHVYGLWERESRGRA